MRGRRLPRLPVYREAFIFYRRAAGSDPRSETARQRGSNTTNPVKLARVLRALDVTELSDVTLPPANSVPPTDRSEPGASGAIGGWTAWWPDPPTGATPSGTYIIPDPPTIDAPVQPTLEAPVLWEASAEIGTGVWTASVQAVYALGDWRERSGSEVMSGHVEMAVNAGTIKIKPSVVNLYGINAQQWRAKRVRDSSVWDIDALIEPYYRGEFIEVLVERQGRLTGA